MGTSTRGVLPVARTTAALSIGPRVSLKLVHYSDDSRMGESSCGKGVGVVSNRKQIAPVAKKGTP